MKTWIAERQVVHDRPRDRARDMTGSHSADPLTPLRIGLPARRRQAGASTPVLRIKSTQRRLSESPEYNCCVLGRNCPLCKEPLPQGLVGFPLCPACQETVLRRAEADRDREIIPGHLTAGELVDVVRGFMDRWKPPN